MTRSDFALHSLGWKAFQQLCGSILREVWGQTFQVFADCNDAGRDGAYHGEWKAKGGRTLSGNTVVQCKFTSQTIKSITLSDLSDEFSKATQLARSGLADNYVLLTNSSLTGVTDAAIRRGFEKIPGLNQCLCYGREWICSIIAENKRLRMLVPRLYGLGDLTQILDARAQKQAKEILASLDDELGKFVLTKAHQDSVEALNHYRFVLLLGEPACGKSTIASALALGAADQWQSQLIKIDTPEQFRAHWNPEDPRQFFWVDDAFGQTQYERPRALQWNHAFPGLAAAIKQGAAVVFTSRDYKHPTIRDAYGSLVSDEPDLIDVYRGGTKIDSLFSEVTCGEMRIKGVKLIIPSGLWPRLITRLHELDLTKYEQRNSLYDFLADRCTKDFLGQFLSDRPDFIASLRYGSWMRYHSAVHLVTRLHAYRLLPEDERKRFVLEASKLAIRTPDADFLDVPKIRALFRKSEIDSVLRDADIKLGPKLRAIVAETRRDCLDEDADPDQHFWMLQRAIGVFRSRLPVTAASRSRFSRADRQISRHIETLKKKKKKLEILVTEEKMTEAGGTSARSIFDDVDES